MKKYIPTIAQIAVYIGLPASFIAAAFHQIAPHVSTLGVLTNNEGNFLASVVFVSTVMSFALIIVHNLREDQRLTAFTNLHLRLSPVNTAAERTSRKARLATARAI